MKRYLISGALTLISGLLITSCHDKMDSEYISNPVTVKTEEFDKAFKEAFTSNISPDQDWGFGIKTTQASTRSHDVNGNLWYQNWERPKNVGSEVSNEVQLVLNEFSKLRYNAVNTINIDWNNYWVQQVYQSKNSYQDANGNNTGDIHGSMNKIIAYNEGQAGYEHVNNFNNGTNTTEYTDDVTKEKFIGTTLMKDMGATPSGTPKFGYHNTKDSKDHFEYIIIPGERIDSRLKGYYYVGFDFLANDDRAQTTFKFKPDGANSEITINVDGIYKPADNANGTKVKTTVTEWVVDDYTTWAGHNETREVEYTVGQGGTWRFESYQYGNMWIDRDWRFNDWIVRISPAKSVNGSGSTDTPGTDTPGSTDNPGAPDDPVPTSDDTVPEPTPVEDTHEYTASSVTTKTEYFKARTLLQYGRVFCEDLGGNYASNRKDFDYNDVVFDAYLWKEEECMKVTEVTTYLVQVWKKESVRVPEYATNEDGTPQLDENGQIKYIVDESNNPTYIDMEVDVLDESASYTRSEETNVYYLKAGTDPKYYADIYLLACGATKPVKIGSTDSNMEVHNVFGGYAVDCIINCFDEHTVSAGGFGYHEIADPVGPDDFAGYNKMDLTSEFKGHNVTNPTIADIPIYVLWNSTAAVKITAHEGGVPHKFMSTSKDKWTSERCFLGDAYPQFAAWAETPSKRFSLGASDNHLYNGYPSYTAGLPFEGEQGFPSDFYQTAKALEIEMNRTEWGNPVINSNLVENVDAQGNPYTPEENPLYNGE